MKRYLAGLTILLVLLLGRATRAPASGSSASIPISGDAYLPFIARQQPPTPTATPTVTPTITATPIPPFAGVVQIFPVWWGMNGWGWQPGADVQVMATAEDGTLLNNVAVQADALGDLPWTSFGPLREGDWISVTVGSDQTGFPIRLLHATADPVANTIVGIARPYARVHANVEHPKNRWNHTEGVAAADGSFWLDFSPLVDWEYGDRLDVGQFLNANGSVNLTNDSPELWVVPPPTATPTQTPTPTATPAHDGPPCIQITVPTGTFYTGRTYTASVTVSDVDNNVSDVTAVQQLGMGDRYAGSEYVTAQELPQLILDGEKLVVKADYPGNYRLWVRATDTTGLTSEESIDLPVYWAPGENPFEIRGICDGLFTPQTIDEAITVLDRMVEDGANYVQLNPLGYMESGDSTEVTILPPAFPWNPDAPGGTYSDEQLYQIIDAAHQRGLKVMIKPQIQIGNWEPASWQIAPSDWDAWFENYSRIVEHYARIAQDTRCEALCVGNELLSTHSEVESWRNMVAEIREIFDGQLTYSDLYLMGGWYGYLDFPAWDLMDLIGISYYPNSTGLNTPDPPNTNPPFSTMVENALHRILDRVQAAHQRYGLDVIATEMGVDGYYDGINIFPGTQNAPPGTPPDYQEVVDFFEARHTVMAMLSSWFVGGMEWKIQMRNPPWSPPSP